MSTVQMFLLLAAIYLAPHASPKMSMAVGVASMIVATIIMLATWI